jgi:hypothetical protein
MIHSVIIISSQVNTEQDMNCFLTAQDLSGRDLYVLTTFAQIPSWQQVDRSFAETFHPQVSEWSLSSSS